jgi:hypothetical protein
MATREGGVNRSRIKILPKEPGRCPSQIPVTHKRWIESRTNRQDHEVMDQPLALATIPRSTRGSTRMGERNRTKKQSTQALADRPARRGGPFAQASRTVRPEAADRPRHHRGPSVKAHRTTRSDPRKTDRTPRPGGPSAPPADRPLLKHGPFANWLQQKPKAKPDRKRGRARTRRTHNEHATHGPSATTPRTVRQVRIEQKTPDPESQLPQIIIGFPKQLKLWIQGFGYLKSVTQGCYSPKILPPNSLNHRESQIL